MEIPDLPTWQPHSSLFTIRLWPAACSEASQEVRMQVRHVLSGETRYFRDWAQLADYLEQKLHEVNEARLEKGENENCP